MPSRSSSRGQIASAIIAGIFLLASAIISGVFLLKSKDIEERNFATATAIAATVSALAKVTPPAPANRFTASFTYYDFENTDELKGWQTGMLRSTDHAFSGQYALKGMIPVQSNQETGLDIRWQREFSADVIVGQVYWPKEEQVELVYTAVCVPFSSREWSCVEIPQIRNGWNAFVLDLNAMKDKPSGLRLPGLHFIIKVRGTKGTSLATMPMYIDFIQIYQNREE